MKMLREKKCEFRVGTFPLENGKYTAYTMWYNTKWTGCKEYFVRAKNGTEAKKIAIQKRKKEEELKDNIGVFLDDLLEDL